MVCQMNFTVPHCDQIVTVQTGLQAGQMGSDHRSWITEKALSKLVPDCVYRYLVVCSRPRTQAITTLTGDRQCEDLWSS